jgi:steroid 5-alpha reductase family enzyme
MVAHPGGGRPWHDGRMDLFAATALAVAACMGTLWGLSVALRNASIVDVFWGLGFALIAWLGLARAGGDVAPRQWLVAVLVGVWGVRLAGYLLWRNAGRGEDPRYVAMRRRIGPRFWWVSLFSVFALQGVLLWIVSLPVQVVMRAPGGPLGVLDALGALVCAVGLGFEALGDWQLARFKADPANAGRVMDRGLWRYTRHPNYFGDACVWWGLFAIALATPLGPWSVVGPALMTFLLLRVSGVPLLERSMARRRPEYAAYAARTSAFFPRPPRQS